MLGNTFVEFSMSSKNMSLLLCFSAWFLNCSWLLLKFPVSFSALEKQAIHLSSNWPIGKAVLYTTNLQPIVLEKCPIEWRRHGVFTVFCSSSLCIYGKCSFCMCFPTISSLPITCLNTYFNPEMEEERTESGLTTLWRLCCIWLEVFPFL